MNANLILIALAMVGAFSTIVLIHLTDDNNYYSLKQIKNRKKNRQFLAGLTGEVTVHITKTNYISQSDNRTYYVMINNQFVSFNTRTEKRTLNIDGLPVALSMEAVQNLVTYLEVLTPCRFTLLDTSTDTVLDIKYLK